MASAVASKGRVVRIGFFEGGDYSAHSGIRNHLRTQLPLLLPDTIDVLFVPQGFKSAAWSRDSTRILARELAADRTIDLVFAFGPWTVEDLLDAGFDRPIVAIYRADPELEGLLDETSRPVAKNLTVRLRPSKIRQDLVALTGFLQLKKLGLLFFPSGNEFDARVEEFRELGATLGFEVTAAQAFDTDSTYAYFKALGQLPGDIDALYVGPLWGFDSDKMKQFYARNIRERRPVFSAEGEYHVARGALAGGGDEAEVATARLHAWKAAQIILGATPASLPVIADEQPGLSANLAVADQFSIPLADDLWLGVNLIEGPPPAEAEHLTLPEAVLLAKGQNPGYLATAETIAQATADVGRARATYWPQVTLSASAQHVDANTVHNNSRFDQKQYGATLGLDQNLLSLKTLRQIQTTKIAREEAINNQRSAALDLELAITLAYLTQLQSGIVKQVQQAYRRQIETVLQASRVIADSDDSAPLDVLRWEDERLKVVADISAARADKAISRILLNRLLGRPGDIEVVLDQLSFTDRRLGAHFGDLKLLAGEPGRRREVVEELAWFALAENPELIALGLESELVKSRMRENSARFFPTIGFRAQLHMTDELQEGGGFFEEHNSWSVGAHVELPLFLGGERIQERRGLAAGLSSAQYRKDDRFLAIQAEVGARLEELLSLGTRFILATKSVEYAADYARSSVDEYVGGARSVADLLDALGNSRQTTLAAVALQFDFFRAQAFLVREIGWSPAEQYRTAGDELLEQLTAPESRDSE